MELLRSSQQIKQLFRYLVVGAGANFLGYSIYLVITSAGIDSLLGMTLIYLSACLASFVGNKRWTFSDKSKGIVVLPRYICVQIAGYLTNLFLLLALSRYLGFAHQAVQLVAIVVVAIEVFLLSKYYVF